MAGGFPCLQLACAKWSFSLTLNFNFSFSISARPSGHKSYMCTMVRPGSGK